MLAKSTSVVSQYLASDLIVISYLRSRNNCTHGSLVVTIWYLSAKTLIIKKLKLLICRWTDKQWLPQIQHHRVGIIELGMHLVFFHLYLAFNSELSTLVSWRR